MLARARAGDRYAFADLYVRYVGLVRGVLLARAPRSDCDDLAQEVFIRAWQRLDDLRSDESLGPWLAASARARAGDHRRTAARRARREAAAAARSTRDTSAEGITAARALDAIRSLPEAYRDTLALRLIEQMPGPLIARRLGLTEGSVRVNLHRGMKLLRERLGIEEAAP
ncbi:MAG: sigma-70 family RNA polymerase sigma factor [Leptolyngbya sp. PLA2]|nr:sigma-70 family RNA polymerase sigma factor [Leptolyngbya sp. PL-A2]MCQ3940517.1 sigma-70 family RNA polymerase sigma factor [cyanobacterium CYA1]MDL1904369.1 sigma-70 family RNA polymerase sigma factor [Synechococcales cyanobacterium CNB]